MNTFRHAAALTLAGAMTLALALPAAGAETHTPAYNIHALSNSPGAARVDLPKSFTVGAKVLSGDQTGSMNWDSGLTRAEAATMLLRLMGLEEEAQAARNDPSPFTDVPEWANGYVNLAQKKGLVKGVGEGRFDPSGECGAKEFLVMLFRLTHLTEGADYSWSTAVDDFFSAVSAVEQDRAAYLYSPGFNYGASGQSFKSYVDLGGVFTREAAAGAMYLMLSIDAGEDQESLGDILAQEYGLSSLLLYDNSVRRTAGALAEQTTLSISSFTGEAPTVFTLEGGKLHVDDSAGTVFTTNQTGDEGWITLSGAKPLALPKSDFDVSVSYAEVTRTYFSDDGAAMTDTVDHSVNLPILYQGGSWTFAPRSAKKDPDYAYLHAYHDEAHWIRVIESEYPAHVLDGHITEDIRSLAASLTAGKTSDYDKAKAICQWVATHIFYDVTAARTDPLASDAVAQTVLETRKGVCGGYANLTRELMRAAGLECYVETSHVADHAWNAAQLDGRWVVIDNTWDSPLKYQDGVYLDPQANYGEGKPVADYLNPQAASLGRYFDADLDTFYDAHQLDRAPIAVD